MKSTGTRFIPALMILLAMSALSPRSVRADAELPPRPTVEPTPALPMTGGLLYLAVTFPADWSWADHAWYAPWTSVEWQDDQGVWHQVEGWQGPLTQVTVTPEGVVGERSWWFPDNLLSRGPFRWTVSTAREGTLLGVSESFVLHPTTINVTLICPE